MKKYFGIFAILAGIGLTYITWNDPVEGAYVRPAAIVIAIVGVIAVLFGIRDDIIRRQSGHEVRCPKCNYNMRGLREARCPECGHETTLDELHHGS